jgi:dienelactone hydrolase
MLQRVPFHPVVRRPVPFLALAVALASVASLAPLSTAAAAAAATTTASPLWGDLEPGPHAVGFQILERRDPARPFHHPLDLDGRPRAIDLARPLQIGVWYPAQAGTGTAMRMADYVAAMGGEQDFGLDAAERVRRGEAAYFAFPLVREASPEQRRALLAMAAVARRDATPASGRFPVVLWSLGSPAVYEANAEHLASHGYVVAILPRLPPTASLVDNSPTRADYDAKSRDLDALLAEVARLPFADAGNVGVTGFSAGGRWAIGEAMRNPAVRAVVSQDSILLFGDDGGQHATMPYYDPDRVRAPVLHMIRREWVPRETNDLWAAMRNADRTRIVFEDAALDHLDFSSIGFAATRVGLRTAAKDAAAAAFAAWPRATLWFFDAHLKGDAAAAARIADLPRSLGLATGAVTVERKAAEGPGPDELQLAEALGDDFAGALPRVRALLAAQGGSPGIERSLNLSAYQLLGSGRADDAMALFQLNTETFAGSANAWDSLADGYEATRAPDKALAATKKALELLAKDTTTPEARREAIRRSAEDRLARLGGARAGGR